MERGAKRYGEPLGERLGGEVWAEGYCGEDLGGLIRREIEVRWGLPGDEARIAELLELNGMPPLLAFEGWFIVAEEEGEVIAALEYKKLSERLLLGLLIADPWVEERPVAVALYAGAEELAREIRAEADRHGGYLYEAGYRPRWGGGWYLDATRVPEGRPELPRRGWRRILALLGIVAVPFFRAFRDQDSYREDARIVAAVRGARSG